MSTSTLEKTVVKENYHKRPEWSYSQMKVILDSGIDYAVAMKKGLFKQTYGAAVDLGQLVHFKVLGGEDDIFAFSTYDNFRTKAAQTWRDEQINNGRYIITLEQSLEADKIVANILSHPHHHKFLGHPNSLYEQEMSAKVNGISLRGKADDIVVQEDSALVIDLKTTAQFDKFFKNALYMHYDLQASTYSLMATSSLNLDASLVKAVYCVAETVEPYRVQYFTAGVEFNESGDNKLHKCLEAIKNFGDKEPTFLLTEIKELGDWS